MLAAIPAVVVAWPTPGLVLTGLYLLIARRQRPWPWTIPTLTIGLVALLATLVSQGRLASLVGAGELIALGTGLVLLYQRLATDDRAALAFGFAGAGALLAAGGVAEVLIGDAAQSSAFRYHHTVTAALALVCMWGSLGGLAVVGRGWTGRALLIVGAAAALAGAGLTMGRGMAAALLGGLLLGALFVAVRAAARAGPGRAVAVALLALALLGAGTWGFVEILERLPGDEASGPFASALRDPLGASGGRIGMWAFSLRLAAARPVLGYGFGVVDELVRPQAPRFTAFPLEHPHSFYLQLLLQGGSALLVAVLMWLAVVGAWVLRLAWAGDGAALAGVLALVAAMVQSVFDPVLAHADVVALVWLVLLMGLATPSRDGDGSRS